MLIYFCDSDPYKRTLEGHTKDVLSLAVLHNDDLASSSIDTTIIIRIRFLQTKLIFEI